MSQATSNTAESQDHPEIAECSKLIDQGNYMRLGMVVQKILIERDKAREEMNHLKRSSVEFALAESAHVEEVKRLREAMMTCSGSCGYALKEALADQTIQTPSKDA